MATTPTAKPGVAAAKKTPVRRTVRVTASKAVPAKPLVRKPATKVAAKKVAAPKAVSPIKTAAPVAKVKAVAAPKKVKLVRDSFSFPEHEHAMLTDLKKRARKLGQEFKKSEILRAGIAHLTGMADSALLVLLSKVERVKTGRPAKKSKKK